MLVLTLGLLLSLSCYFIAFPKGLERRLTLYLPIALLHVAAGVAFWLFAESQPADANMYYLDPYRLADDPFQPGTVFVVQFVQFMKLSMAGSFFDQFMLFQAFGLIGLALLLRCLMELGDLLQVRVPNLAYGLLLLPGLHFWTAAIGKDAPVFMGVCLSIWAALRIERRFVWFGLAVAVMFLFRPHIAALACLALVGAFLVNRRMPVVIKAVLIPLAIGAFTLVAATAQDQLGLTTVDSKSLTDFVDRTQNAGSAFSGGADLAGQPFIIKLLSLLFRPFFFDAAGLFAYAASLENLLLIGVFYLIAIRALTLFRIGRSAFFVPYCAILVVILATLLALVNYNVGLGLRQKMMFMPAVIILFSTVLMHRRYMLAIVRRSPKPEAGPVSSAIHRAAP